MLAILTRSGPYSTLEAAEALRHLGGIEVLGYDEGIGVFVDDGVYVLHNSQSVPEDRTSLGQAASDLAAKGVKLIAERDSLTNRGLTESDMVDGVEIRDSIIDVLLEAETVLVF